METWDIVGVVESEEEARLAEALTLLDQRDAAEPAPEPGTAPADPSNVEI